MTHQRIGQILMQEGRCDRETLMHAWEQKVLFGDRLGTNLLAIAALNEQTLAEALGKQAGVHAAWGAVIAVNTAARDLLSPLIAKRRKIVGHHVEGPCFYYLTIDPLNPAIASEVAAATRLQPVPVVVCEVRMWELQNEHYGVAVGLRPIDLHDLALLLRQAQAETPAPLAIEEELTSEDDFYALYQGKAGQGVSDAVSDFAALESAGLEPMALEAAALLETEAPNLRTITGSLMVPTLGNEIYGESEEGLLAVHAASLEAGLELVEPIETVPVEIAANVAIESAIAELKLAEETPVIAESAPVEPAIAEVSLVAPVIAESAPVEPAIAEVSLVAPIIAENVSAEPVIAESAPVEPAIAEASLVAPVIAENVSAEPVIAESAPIIAAAAEALNIAEPLMDLSQAKPSGADITGKFSKPVLPVESEAAPDAAVDPLPQMGPSHSSSRLQVSFDDSPLTFAEATSALEQVKGRSEIARIVLRFAVGRFSRAALLTVHPKNILGWEGIGEGVTTECLATFRLPRSEKSVFSVVAESRAHYIGPLQRWPGNGMWVKQAGRILPQSVAVFPVLVRGQVVNLFYGDKGHGQHVDSDVGELLILAQKISASYESLIRR